MAGPVGVVQRGLVERGKDAVQRVAGAQGVSSRMGDARHAVAGGREANDLGVLSTMRESGNISHLAGMARNKNEGGRGCGRRSGRGQRQRRAGQPWPFPPFSRSSDGPAASGPEPPSESRRLAHGRQVPFGGPKPGAEVSEAHGNAALKVLDILPELVQLSGRSRHAPTFLSRRGAARAGYGCRRVQPSHPAALTRQALTMAEKARPAHDWRITARRLPVGERPPPWIFLASAIDTMQR